MDVKAQSQAVQTLTQAIEAVKEGKCNNLLLCYEDGDSLHRQYVGNPVTIIGIMTSQATLISMDMNRDMQE